MDEYISRDALLQDISETVLFSVRGNAELPTAEMRGARKVIDRIKSVPAADVVERKDLRALVEYLEKKIVHPYGKAKLEGAKNKKAVSIDILKYAFRDRKDDDNG